MLVAVGFTLAGANELLVLLGAGIAAALGSSMVSQPKHSSAALIWGGSLSPLLGTATPGALNVAAQTTFGLWPLFTFFLKVGTVLYGSGYVLLAFLRSGLVERFCWLTETQLLDAVAVGQITPGPVFTTATFIGYLLGGFPAAIVATVAIFLPAFLFVAISGPLIPWLRRSPVAGAFLDGVTAASCALMAVVTFQLGRAALVDPLAWSLTILATILLFRYLLNSAWLVLVGAGAGVVKLVW